MGGTVLARVDRRDVDAVVEEVRAEEQRLVALDFGTGQHDPAAAEQRAGVATAASRCEVVRVEDTRFPMGNGPSLVDRLPRAIDVEERTAADTLGHIRRRLLLAVCVPGISRRGPGSAP